ncbi:MAG: serine hydrolase [Patescibacteria group bacterium]|nr:serine hydrolase [Patescibacteria group bacterium]
MNIVKNKKSLMRNVIKFSLFLFLFLSTFFLNIDSSQAAVVDNLSGKILLQVEKNGEAWYIKPSDKKRVFLSRPTDAFNIMRELGLGVSNYNLENIPSKQESFSDDFDLSLSKKLSGKILLQVEENGEAYYINPDNFKKYYLGRPADAFNVMRELGLGVSDSDISTIEIDDNFNYQSEDAISAVSEIDLDVLESDTRFEIDYSSKAFTKPVELVVEKEFTVKNLPWSLHALSPLYNYNFKTDGLYDPAHTFTVKIYYNEDNYNLKRLFNYDPFSKTFKEIEIKENLEDNYIYYTTNSTSDKLILMNEDEIMNRGKASWYKYKNGLFAASPDYPKSSILKVTNLDNNKSVEVEINDYGPDRSIFPDRVIDLDYVAFSEIASPSSGIIDVKVEVVNVADDKVEISSLEVTPVITANSAIVMNEKNNEIIYSKNPDQVVPIASLTKIVFAQVFLNLNVDFDKEVVYKLADEELNVLYCQPKSDIKLLRVEEGDVLTVRDLFYSALMYSGNNAVETLVRNSGISRDEFILQMNKYAENLGAENTNFIEPTGLSPKNVSSVKDYAIISKEVFKNKLLHDISSTKYYSFKTVNTDKEFKLYNTNRSINNNTYNIEGSKTGYLHESGYCLTTKVTQGEDSLIVINLNSDSRDERESENEKLANYGFKMINQK